MSSSCSRSLKKKVFKIENIPEIDILIAFPSTLPGIMQYFILLHTSVEDQEL